ncbi:MAG: ATP-binding protein [Bacteroidota bacterium]
MLKLLLLPVLILLQLTAISQQQQPLFNHQQWYRTDDGLPQGFITGIVQDRQGFIWAGTLDGVVRFDGKTFKTFRNDPADSTSLSSSRTGRFTMDENGKILVLSFERGTMDELDPETGRARRLGNFFSKTGFYNSTYIQRGPGARWTYFYGGLTGQVDTTRFQKIPFIPPGGLRKGEVFLDIPLKAKEGEWLLPSNEALYFLDKDFKVTHSDTFPHLFPNQPALGATRGNSCFVTLHGSRMVITTSSMLYLWDIRLRQLTALKMPDSVSQEFRSELAVGHDGLLYMVRFDKVYRMETDNQFTLVWQNTLQPGRRITSMLIDRSGVLWLGLNAAGIVKVTLESVPFSSSGSKAPFHKEVLSLLGVPAKDLVAIGDDKFGAYMFRYTPDSEGGYFFNYRFQIGNGTHLYHFANGNMTELPLPIPAGRPNILTLSGLHCDANGGLYAYDETYSRLLHWAKNSQTPAIQELPKDSFPVTRVWGWGSDMVAVAGSLWLSTNGSGLYQIKDGKVLQWLRPESKGTQLPAGLSDLCIDPLDSNFIWVGSLGSGMFRLNRLNGSIQNITMQQGLPNNTVYGIVPDKMGNLWVSTNKGIARYDPRTGTVHGFEKSDGLPGNEYNRSHHFYFPDGRIAFGGTEGMVVFNPADFRVPANTANTNLQLTSIEINGKEQLFGAAGSLLDTPLSRLSVMYLPYNRNFVTIEFASLLFNDPQKIRYRYRLLGVEEEWNEAGNTRMARYTQLRPGTYTFQVNATGFDGRYTTQVKELKFIVQPPFWATWWAWLFYIVLATTCCWLGFRYYQKRRAEKALQLAEHLEAERLKELDTMKEQFFSNITHELRTPITLISAPLEQLSQEGDLSNKAQQMVATAQSNSERLLRLINQILDINKIEAGHLKLQETTGEPALFFAGCVEKFAVRAVEKGVSLSSDLSAISGYYLFDREKWETIIFNLLGNALKFTPPGGNVMLQASVKQQTQTEDLLLVRVSDTGVGIAASELEQVFNRYYQAGSKSMQYHGTGIGLALVKDLVQLMRGTITAESEPGLGTTFNLSIPVQKSDGKTAVALPAIENLRGSEKDLGGVMDDAPQKELKGSEKLVLLVEDNDELRSYISNTLAANYKVITATNGREGREKMLAEMPDLVVSDMMMPVMDGVEFCRICKKDTRTAHVPFVLLTSRASQDAKLEGLGSGADDYVTKPFNISELQLRLGNLLNQQQRQRQYWEQQMNLQSPDIPAANDPFLEELYLQIEKRLDDSELGVDSLARQMGLSQSSLNRKLKVLTGTSANDLVRTYRLKKAAGFISAGHDISQAAYMTGFTSPSYFTQRFKEFFGKTPSNYLS